VHATRFTTDSPGLTRDEIVHVAQGYATTGGLAELTIRQLATDLDVTPMALYRHVRDKDDILEAVADRLIGDLALPPSDLPWAEYLSAMVRSLRDLLRQHPAIIGLYARQPLTTPAAKARLVAARAALVAAGFDEAEATRTYATFHSFTIGFCALEAGRGLIDPIPPGPTDDDELGEALHGFVTDEQFEHGLAVIAAGIERKGPTP
jgi:AcrR family transcriptional regulator